MHQSIATIDAPQFINLSPLDINPLMSSCEIKVLYLGENRNHSYISKEVAIEMSKSLRGAPIVGYYRQENNDFYDHGDRIVFEDGKIKFDCLTVPYGFVAPDAKVWFKTFEEIDEFGNPITREYLMTTGFLWTGQFEEAALATEEGRPHSMELDENTLKGNWATNLNTGMEFFIINDAIFSKLCILGNDVEPCFEGSSVTAPKVSASFTVDDEFKNTLFSMMQELKTALEGGQKMANVAENSVVEENLEIQDNVEKTFSVEIEESTEDTNSTEVVEENETVEEVVSETVVETETEFAKKEEDKEEKSEESKSEGEDKKEDSKEESEDDKKKKEEDEFACGNKKKYELLEAQYSELEAKYNALAAECEALRTFKCSIEDAKKDELINSFYMLDEADKKDVVDNKSKYSLEEIEAKLSVIYTRKNINFTVQETESKEEASEEVTTYSLADEFSGKSDWILECLKTQEQMNN